MPFEECFSTPTVLRSQMYRSPWTRANLGGLAGPSRGIECQWCFRIPRAADGEWRLAVEVGKQRVTQWIDMAGRDLQDVKLHLASPFTVRSQVVMETPQGTKGPDA
jgi:hypothetical protein